MEFFTVPQLAKRKKADLLVIPFWAHPTKPQAAVEVGTLESILAPALETGDFHAKEGEILLVYAKGLPEQRVALLGLGRHEQLKVESLRRSYGSLTKQCLGKKIRHLNLTIPATVVLPYKEIIQGMAEGLLLPNYVFDRMKQHSEGEEAQEPSLIETLTWIAPDSVLEVVHRVEAICDGVYYARDLINGNADDITPQYLVSCAKGLAQELSHTKVTLFDKKRLEKENFGLLLAVNRGSPRDPALIILEYKGQPKSKNHTVLVGKGITFDTGGLNLKMTGMETMKSDMGGAAACLGALLAISNLELKVNVTIVIPTTENCIDGHSFKPGDVYTSYSGKKVEMTNTDAEGRLILADAIAYASAHLQPTRIIDIATLTGAIEVALGSEASGLMCTDETLAQQLIAAGERTFERVWRMPLYDEYKERLKSDIADLKSWNGRSGGACVAATFIRSFVDSSIPWAHLDIAGTAYLSEAKRYLPKYGTGAGVRLLVDLIENL